MSDSENDPSRRMVRAQKNYQRAFDSMLRSRGIPQPRNTIISMRELGFEPLFRVEHPPLAPATPDTVIGMIYGLASVFTNVSLFYPDRVQYELFSPELPQILEGEFFDSFPDSEFEIRAIDAKPIFSISKMQLRFRIASASRPAKLEDPSDLVWHSIPIQPEHINELANLLRRTTPGNDGLLSAPRLALPIIGQ